MRPAPLLALVLALAGCAAAPRVLPEARLASRAPDARCSACTLPLADAAYEWPDGRVVCRSCRDEGVVDPAAAHALLDLAHADLRVLFGIELGSEVLLTLVDLATLQVEARELAHPALQAFSSVERLDERRAGRVRIEVLYGLPAVALRGILVHELFHAHQTASRGGDATSFDLGFIEGAAQYVQLRVLQELGAGGWAGRLLANEDPVYGEGLRRFRRLVVALGEERALELGATLGRFPQGH